MISKIAIIITAAGSSTRMGSGIKKEYLPFQNGTVLSTCATTFLKACSKKYTITDFIITCPINKNIECEKALNIDKDFVNLKNQYLSSSSFCITNGSSTRQKSVYNALLAIKNEPDLVIIHDGARPFVTTDLIIKTIEEAFLYGAAVPGLTPTDTQKEIDENGFITRHLKRASLCAVQTPQAFIYKKLLEAHKLCSNEESEYTDDTEIWGKYVGNVKVVSGDLHNKKITYKGDL